MEYSYLFYGYYYNTVVENQNVTYNIPLAYILTAVFYFALCLIFIIARWVLQTHSHSASTISMWCVCVSVCVCVASQWRVSAWVELSVHPPLPHSMGANARVAVATGGSTMGDYSMIVFTGWDYSCLRDRDTKLKQKNIHYRLQVRGDLSHLARIRAREEKRDRHVSVYLSSAVLHSSH